MKNLDVIVVGGGLAGLRAAVALNQKNVKVGVISRVYPIRSHSVEAQGGINASLGNHVRGGHDDWKKHAFDTIKGSDYLADQQAAARLTQEAVECVFEMEHWGCAFSRTEDGKIAQRPFGGAGFPRTCYASDKTGHVLLHTLYEQICKYEYHSEREQMLEFNEWYVTSVVIDDGCCQGVIAMNVHTGELEAFMADAVIFATGGSGRIYGKSTNALINGGRGMAMPFWAGVPLKDMEFIQFHPTTLYGTNILMTEGCRGEGGFLLNKDGGRFLADYDDSRKAMEVAPRDIVSRNLRKEIQKGKGIEDAYVHLDLRHLGEKRINERLPGIRHLCQSFAGVDPVYDLVPIQPAQHYTMGGIDTNIDAETKALGLYAAGECACVSVHGANRLGGNSLLETIVFGKIAGEKVADYVLSGGAAKKNEKALNDALKRDNDMINSFLKSSGKESHPDLKKELNDTMDNNVGIFREKQSLEAALDKVRELKHRFKMINVMNKQRRMNQELLNVLDLEGGLDVAEVLVMGALEREESRGSQSRTDFQKRDDANWLKHTLAFYTSQGTKLEYSDVDISMYEPKERKY